MAGCPFQIASNPLQGKKQSVSQAPGKNTLGAKYLSFGNYCALQSTTPQRRKVPAPKGKAGSSLPNRGIYNVLCKDFIVSGSKSYERFVCLSRCDPVQN